MLSALIFGAFVGFLTDFWLGRGRVADPARLFISVVVGAVLAVLVLTGHQAVF